jgi:hypothetical protein
MFKFTDISGMFFVLGRRAHFGFVLDSTIEIRALPPTTTHRGQKYLTYCTLAK